MYCECAVYHTKEGENVTIDRAWVFQTRVQQIHRHPIESRWKFVGGQSTIDQLGYLLILDTGTLIFHDWLVVWLGGLYFWPDRPLRDHPLHPKLVGGLEHSLFFHILGMVIPID